jgi:Rrf2 family nitric oxide-sensitive transcriptional repressor
LTGYGEARNVRLSLQTDYALRTLLYLGSRTGRAKVAEVATFYGISVHHLGKVVHQLGKLGLVRNVRGATGGIELARAPAEIPLGSVIRAFEGSARLLECIDTPDVCAIQPGCRLRGVLAEAERRMMGYLAGVTLADILPPAGADLVTFKVPSTAV